MNANVEMEVVKPSEAVKAEIAKEVSDEICPDRDFIHEEIDPYEAAIDKLIEKALVCPVLYSTVEKEF